MSQLKKISIIGPEATGKSDLAKALSEYYNEPWVPEFAREFLTNLQRPYHLDDIIEIAKGQLNLEDEIKRTARSFLFCDTDLIVIKVWLVEKYGQCPAWITKEISTRHYDLHFLTYPDLPWSADPLRENPNRGDYFFEVFHRELKSLNLPFRVIKGVDDLRLKNAIAGIENFFQNS